MNNYDIEKVEECPEFISYEEDYELAPTVRTALIQEPEYGHAAATASFQTLVSEWKHDMIGVSSVDEMILHPSYQKIIGMGWDALPEILRELSNENGHWYAALGAIVQKDIAEEKKAYTMEDARAAWLEWGYRNNII